jgi:Carboxypeptidase regulatory-like domain
MKIRRMMYYLPLIVMYLTVGSNVRAAGIVTGKVTAEDQTSKTNNVSASAGPIDAKVMRLRSSNGSDPGQNGAVQNVVVYVSPGASGKAASKKEPISIAQDGCHFTEAVLRMGFVPLAPYTGQMVNSADEEIIPVRCDSRGGMRKYFVVLKTSNYSVTGENGTFTLNDLPPGKYTITAWEETYGSQSQEITISGNETVPANFVFRPKSKT